MNAQSPYAYDGYVIDTLMCDLVGHDRRPSAFLVYLMIKAHTANGPRGFSYNELAELTGISRRATQDAVAHLAKRKLIEVNRVGPTDAALYRTLSPWRRSN